MNRLIIVGASGHGKVVADIAKRCGYNDIVFLDDDSSILFCMDYPVLGSSITLSQFDGDVFIAIGNAEIRKKLMEREVDRDFPVLIHPSAVVAEGVEIGVGTVIMAGAVVNPGAKIGRGCILNTSCSVDHDCCLGNYVHVSVGAHLAGAVVIDETTCIGAGATVSNNVQICSNCLIGAGAVVIKSIDTPGIYMGVPARRKN